MTHASKTNEQIIVLDVHHSHKTLEAINFCRDNGIHLITLPSHCTHKIQPLDCTFFKLLNIGYNAAASNWMLSHQVRRILFFDKAGIFATVYIFTANIDKAMNGFRCSGLYSAENLTSSLFKKRLEEHKNNVKEKQQAVILCKEKAGLSKVIKQKMKSINLRTKKTKKREKQKAKRPNGRKKPIKRKKDMVSVSECFITDTTLCIICPCTYNVPPFDDWYHSSCGPDDSDFCYYCES